VYVYVGICVCVYVCVCMWTRVCTGEHVQGFGVISVYLITA
jgi:hypothetical protein